MASANQIVFVSALPPSRCGVATYAADHLLRLRADGATVITLGMLADSHADYTVDIRTVAGAWSYYQCARRLRCAKLIVHYADDMYFPVTMPMAWSRKLCRLFQALALRTLARHAATAELIVHELPLGINLPAANTRMRASVFSLFQQIHFHTENMRGEFLRRFPEILANHTGVIDHARFMRRHYAGSKTEARSELGLPQGQPIFLCLGFLHAAKGFHDAIEAFQIAGIGTDASLHVVGSSHGSSPYPGRLGTLCASVAGAYLHVGYLDDSGFDRWLAAADWLILPYTGVASSGVGARASLFGTSLILRDLPNLVEQFPGAPIFTSTTELAELMRMAVQTTLVVP